MIPRHHKDVTGTRKFFVFNALLSPASNGRGKNIRRHADDKDTYIVIDSCHCQDAIAPSPKGSLFYVLGPTGTVFSNLVPIRSQLGRSFGCELNSHPNDKPNFKSLKPH